MRGLGDNRVSDIRLPAKRATKGRHNPRHDKRAQSERWVRRVHSINGAGALENTPEQIMTEGAIMLRTRLRSLSCERRVPQGTSTVPLDAFVQGRENDNAFR